MIAAILKNLKVSLFAAISVLLLKNNDRLAETRDDRCFLPKISFLTSAFYQAKSG